MIPVKITLVNKDLPSRNKRIFANSENIDKEFEELINNNRSIILDHLRNESDKMILGSIDLTTDIIPVFKDNNIIGFTITSFSLEKEKCKNEYRKFIEENKYRRIKRTTDFRPLRISGVQCSESNGNNIIYDSRRLFDDMG